jgi:hypothetical protein
VRYSGEVLMSFCLMVIAAGVVITSLNWPFRAALFPVIVGISVFFLAMAELLFNLFGNEELDEKESTMDFKLSEGIDHALETRRTLLTSMWIMGFFLMILFFGFPIAVPLWFFLHLRIQAKEGWAVSLVVTASTWVFFYGLFVWLLDIPFMEGWVLRGLRSIGIG